MKLPKRVPWSNISELEQICSWIYADESDITAKVLAVNRLAAWKVSTALPHALDSTLSLLIVILQDEDYSNSSSQSSTLSLRHSYSLALIRLVNGLVDPLQQGAYARPIASLASQIGLPLWLVELRHASTHEELPGLELLRDGAREAMSWLLRNYFLPTISPLKQPVTAGVTLSPLSPLLARYKQLLKTITKDTSLRSRSKPELAAILRDVESWVLEAKVAASLIGFDTETQQDEEYEKDRWALEHFCDALIGRGGLVPVTVSKRPNPLEQLKVPTPQHVALWSPLILHVHSRYPIFPSLLLSRIINRILSSSQPTAASATNSAFGDIEGLDFTYDCTLATWVLWITERWGNVPFSECEPIEVIKESLLGLSRKDNKILWSLVTTLSENDPRLKKNVELLSTAIQPSSRTSTWESDTLDIMSERLSRLGTSSHDAGSSTLLSGHNLEDTEMSAQSDTLGKTSETKISVKGWRLIDESSGWKPCPVGVLYKTDT